MSTFAVDTKNILLFIYKFNSARFLTAFSVILSLLFILGTKVSGGEGVTSTLSVLGFEIPFLLLSVIFHSISLIFSVTLLIIALNLCDFLVTGHVMHVIVARNKNRLLHLGAFFSALFLFMMPVTLGYSAIYFLISPSFLHSFSAFFADLLYFYTITLLIITVVNIKFFRTQPVAFLIVIFFVLPATLDLIIRLPATSTFQSLLKESVVFIKMILTPHFDFSNASETIKIKSYIQSEVFLTNIIILIVYVGFNLFHFRRKDLI